jgi:16S rRNA (uracil1498-N3)-methyltransferase
MQDQPRLYADPALSSLQAGLVLPMREDQAHYLGTVLRRGPGDGVRLFNARDGEWQAVIEGLQRRGSGRFVVDTQLRPPETENGPILLFAPVKRDATDLVARMATELGASALLPVLTERTNTARINTHRLTAIAIEAAEQCERLSVPGVAEPRRLAQVLSEWQPGRRLYAAVERLARDAGTVRMAADEASADALLIGPEGGFTPAELDVLSARPFVTLISLGSRILKAETAAAAGLACLQAARERWGRAPEGVAPH